MEDAGDGATFLTALGNNPLLTSLHPQKQTYHSFQNPKPRDEGAIRSDANQLQSYQIAIK